MQVTRFKRALGYSLLAETILLLVTFATTTCSGQVARYELGNRLRRFELAWESADASVRVLSTGSMEKAVGAFFSLRLDRAAQHLDDAWLVTQQEHPTNDITRWLLSHRIESDERLRDSSERSIRVRLVPFYKVECDDVPEVKCRVRLEKPGSDKLREWELSWNEIVQGAEWQHGLVEAGDYRLSVMAILPNRPDLEIESIMISYCDRVVDRLRDSQEAIDRLKTTGTLTGIATVRSISHQLQTMLKGNVPESDVEANARLQFCEELIEANGKSDQRLNANHPGNYAVTLESENSRLSVRLLVPQKAERPLPVVIAFHGAGGSENMFFETYGAGRIVSLCEQRGWLLVSPQQGLLGLPMNVDEILKVLSEHFAIDRDRVFLVGHSMGAAQVVSQCEQHGESISKAVAIGGGRVPRDAKALVHPEWYVTAGERDFGRRGAATLARGLQQAGASVKYVEVPNVEHMVIVQASLDEIFRFLD